MKRIIYLSIGFLLIAPIVYTQTPTKPDLPIKVNLDTPESTVRSYWRYRDFKDTVNLSKPLTFNELFSDEILAADYVDRKKFLGDFRVESYRSANTFSDINADDLKATVFTYEHHYFDKKIDAVRYRLIHIADKWKIDARFEECTTCDGSGKWKDAGGMTCERCHGTGWNETILP